MTAQGPLSLHLPFSLYEILADFLVFISPQPEPFGAGCGTFFRAIILLNIVKRRKQKGGSLPAEK